MDLSDPCVFSRHILMDRKVESASAYEKGDHCIRVCSHAGMLRMLGGPVGEKSF